MFLKNLTVIASIAVLLSACGPSKEELQVRAAEVAASAAAAAREAKEEKARQMAGQLEENRKTAKANAEFNAQLYKAANPRFTADFSIIGRSDTAQSPDCPSGDGWAELSIMKVDGKVVEKVPVMCSTYSASVGCFRKEDFDKDKNLAGQDGVCNRTLPNPLPALKK